MGAGELVLLLIWVQVAVGAGYLAYATAYAGLRRGHRTTDAVFITLAFAALSLIAFTIVQVSIADRMTAPARDVVAALGAAMMVLPAAALWRRWLREWWQGLMAKTSVHRDDGIYTGWDAAIQRDVEVIQVSVHTTDGRVLYLNDRSKYDAAPWHGLYFGGDGSVIMVVEEEGLPDGTEEVREGVHDDTYGTRMTYLPPAMIRRINIRMLPAKT